MSYEQAIQFLYSLQLFGARPGLERALRLADLAGHPERSLRFIHVAGTNGKGSTCAMLDAIYRAAGFRVGLYTSPHLVSFRERIQINRELIPEADLVRFVQEAKGWLRSFTQEDHPTFFEVVTLMALRYFAEQKCELVIWETGLGGRLDATNIVNPLASVITNVQFDHEKWLGNTLVEIAREKAGIIKPGVPVITAAEGEALALIKETATQAQARCWIVDADSARLACAFTDVIPLKGRHQSINAALAVAVTKALNKVLSVSNDDIERGLRSVSWPGRFQVLQRGTQTIVLDGAHNPAGAEALASLLRQEFPNQPLTLILGILEDKNWERVCRTLAPLAGKVVTTPVASQRTAAAETLATIFREANASASAVSAIHLSSALEMTKHEPVVIITGSLYLVGEALELLGANPAVGERRLNDWIARG